MVYYGISLSGVNLSDDPYMYMMLSGLVEVPAYSLTGPAVERFGRRVTQSIYFFIAAVVLLALGVTPAGQCSRSRSTSHCNAHSYE